MYDLLLVYISFSLTSTIVHSRKLWKPSHLCLFSREENLIMFQKSQLHQVSMNFSCHVPRAAPTNPTFREEQNLSLMITTTQLSLLFNKQGKGLNTVRIPILNHQCSSYDTCIMDTSIWIHTYWIMNTSSWVTPLEHLKDVEGPIPSCRGRGVRSPVDQEKISRFCLFTNHSTARKRVGHSDILLHRFRCVIRQYGGYIGHCGGWFFSIQPKVNKTEICPMMR